jgi:hypothetical protein
MLRNNTWRGFSHSRTRSKQKMDGGGKTLSPEYARPLSEETTSSKLRNVNVIASFTLRSSGAIFSHLFFPIGFWIAQPGINLIF